MAKTQIVFGEVGGGGGLDNLQFIITRNLNFSSSPEYSGYPASAAFDGNIFGKGFFPANYNFTGAYLRVDLGTTRHIKAIGFGLASNTYNTDITHVFDVQYGSSYTTKERKTVTFPSGSPCTTYVFPIDIESQYIGISWVSCDYPDSSVKVVLFE